MREGPNRLERLQVRLTIEQKALIKCAAKLQGQTVADFVRQAILSGLDVAQQDQAVMVVDGNQFDQIGASLRMPAKDRPALTANLSKPAPWATCTSP